MSDIGENLKAYLKTKTPITDLVGSGVAARIYPDDAKQGVSLPYIVYEVFEGTSATHLKGISGVATSRIQVDVYASTRSEAFRLSELIRLAPLQAYRGDFGDTFVHSEHGNSSYRQGRDRPVKGGNQRRHWCSRDYIFSYKEAIE